MKLDIFSTLIFERSFTRAAKNSRSSPQNWVIVLPGMAGMPRKGSSVSSIVPIIMNIIIMRKHLPKKRRRLDDEECII